MRPFQVAQMAMEELKTEAHREVYGGGSGIDVLLDNDRTYSDGDDDEKECVGCVFPPSCTCCCCCCH